MKSLRKEIAQLDEVDLGKSHSLRRLTTYGIGGEAQVVAEPRSEEGLKNLIQFLSRGEIDYFLLGGGSNVLFCDDGYQGVIIRLRHLKHVVFRGNNLRVGAGASTPGSIKKAVAQGLAGWECLVGIPGQIGGAVFMNAGGKYGSIADSITWVRWMDCRGEIHFSRAREIPFGYRKSNLEGIVLEAGFELIPASKEKIKKRCRKYLEEKKSSQPLGRRSAGCMFMNPPGDSAGRLIDAAGLKGISKGEAVISPIHGNFIVNQGRARSRDVTYLIDLIQHRVREKFGIWLKREVRMIDTRGRRGQSQAA